MWLREGWEEEVVKTSKHLYRYTYSLFLKEFPNSHELFEKWKQYSAVLTWHCVIQEEGNKPCHKHGGAAQHCEYTVHLFTACNIAKM
jgi:hypothetical protein